MKFVWSLEYNFLFHLYIPILDLILCLQFFICENWNRVVLLILCVCVYSHLNTWIPHFIACYKFSHKLNLLGTSEIYPIQECSCFVQLMLIMQFHCSSKFSFSWYHCIRFLPSVWCICTIILMFGMSMLHGMQKVAQ